MRGAVILAVAGVVFAIGAGSLSAAEPRDSAISIEADSSIEWVPGESRYTASGNVLLVRDNMQLQADFATAFYTEGEATGAVRKLDRLEASGHVRIASRGEAAWRVRGERATYRHATEDFTVEGDGLNLEFADTVVQAEERLEYRGREQLFLAKGNAVLISRDRRLRTDLLSATLKQDARGEWQIARVDARGGVHISTSAGIVTARNGTYRPTSGTMTVTGDVRVTRAGIQLNGEKAVIDLKSGASRLLGTGGRRVTGVIWPSRLSSEDRERVKGEEGG